MFYLFYVFITNFACYLFRLPLFFGVGLCANESFIVISTFVLKFTVGIVPTELVSILVQGTSGTLIYIFD